MSIESVDILVVDTTLGANPLEGVTVKILTEDGTSVVAQPVTDVNGLVTQLLSTGIYQVRFFKFGVTFTTQLIEILPAVVNQFKIRGEVYTYPQSTDTRICIASGFFRTPSGGLAKGVDVHFIAKFNPLLLEDAAIMPERVTQRTNKEGYMEVPLIRFGQYEATVEGMEDYLRVVCVPDAPAVNIGNLLFPVVDTINFDEVGPYTAAVGDELTLTPHIFSSDLNEITNLVSDVSWTTSDPSLTVVANATTLTVKGTVAGVYELIATRRDTSIVRIPNTPIQGVPLTITITP